MASNFSRTTPALLSITVSAVLLAGCGSDPAEPMEGGPGVEGTGAGAAGTTAVAESAGTSDDPSLAGNSARETPGLGGAGSGPPGPLRPTSDVLTELPDVVYLKTSTQSFNRMYYLAVMDGHLWVKPNVESTNADGPWTKVVVPPDLEGRVAQVSVDDHGVVLFDVDRKLYWTMSGALTVPFSPIWQSSWGAPLATGPGFNLPDPIRKWEYSVLTVQEDEYWVDTAGNHQQVGLGSVAHIWILNDDQQRITFVDPILPVDLSYEMCGPLRGRFESENLSVSGSTSFVINRFGDMFTRLYDFDISGADTLFFQYSYEDQSGRPFPVFQLPAPPWIQQPKIEGEITDRITIYKTGPGSDSRMLRVEGRDADSNVGFYEKPIAAPSSADWVFYRTDEALRGNLLENSPADRSRDALGVAEDRPYARNLTAIDSLDPSGDIVTDADWAGEIADFNLYCTPSTLTIHAGPGVSVDLTLHIVDSIRQVPRARGLDSEPYLLQGTIEVPPAILDRLDEQPPKVRAFITGFLGSRRFSSTTVSATLDRVSLDAFGWVFDHRP